MTNFLKIEPEELDGARQRFESRGAVHGSLLSASRGRRPRENPLCVLDFRHESAPPPGTLPVSSFPAGVPMLSTGPACPIAAASSPLGALSTYSSNDHFVHAGVIWKVTERVTAMVGYGGSFVRGNTIFLNLLSPTGTLDFNNQKPYASIVVELYRGLSYKMAWDYYGYNETGINNPFGLSTIALRDFDGSNGTFPFRYSF